MEPPPSLLLVYPHRHWREALVAALRQMGFLALAFGSGRESLEKLNSVGLIPDLVAFDDTTEDMTPIQFSAALGEILGALAPPVMYVVEQATEVATSPSFKPGRDMVFQRPARARDMIRGIVSGLRSSAEEGRVLYAGGLELGATSRTLEYGGRNVHLTRIEFQFMAYIMRRESQLVTNDELLERVWGFDPGTGTSEVIRAHVRNLRRKLQFLGAPRDLLWTLPGRGYQLRKTRASPTRMAGPDSSS